MTSDHRQHAEHPSTPAIFKAFLKIGVTAFGGPAMVTHIKALVVEKRQWLDDDTFNHGIALCQTLPGAIAVNMASYSGYRLRGLPGMLAAFAGFTLPAFLFMLVLSALYIRTRSLPITQSLFTGLEIIVVSILAHATFTFGKKAFKGPLDVVFGVMGAALFSIKLNPFYVILLTALFGALLYRNVATPPPSRVAAKNGALRDSIIITAAFISGLAILFVTNKTLFNLSWIMAKIEIFAFGGGYTALTLMFHEVVEARQWLDHQALVDGIALGQITPGPILITAAFIGYMMGGIGGAALGTISIFIPGLIMITAILPFFDKLRDHPIFLKAIRGMVSCFVGLLLFVTIKFGTAAEWSAGGALLLLASLSALFARVDILYVVFIGAAASMLIF